MTPNWPMRRPILQFLTLFLLIVLIIAVIYADLLVFGNTMDERSMVQNSQALLILGSAAFFAVAANKSRDQRGYLTLVSTLFLCMFVRENDGLLDNIEHGFWRIPVIIIASVGMIIVIRNRKTLWTPFVQHAQDSSLWILAVGFLQLVVFSRLFGSGQLWHHIPGQGDLGPTKSIVQEGTELMSYALIFAGSFLSYMYQFAGQSGSNTNKTH